jgi:hypothetical protein
VSVLVMLTEQSSLPGPMLAVTVVLLDSQVKDRW